MSDIAAPGSMTLQEAVKKHRSLGIAVKNNDLEAAKVMFPAAKESDKYDPESASVLLWSYAGTLSADMGRLLVQEGANPLVSMPDQTHRNGISVPFKAAELGNQDLIKALVTDELINIDVLDHSGQNLLMAAIRVESEKRAGMVQMLLNLGADPDSQDMGQNTALHYAAGECQFECVVRLVEHGANPSLENIEGSVAAQMIPEEVGEGWDADSLYEMLNEYETAYTNNQAQFFTIPDVIAKQVLMERGEIDAEGNPIVDPNAPVADPVAEEPQRARQPKMF